MTDREKVIRAVETCFDSWIDNHRDMGIVDLHAVERWKRAALELMKEQEPRVLTLDEVDAAEVVWFEARNHIFIEPMLTRGKRIADEAEDWFQYGRDWRCWSSRPTDEQRKAVKWSE